MHPVKIVVACDSFKGCMSSKEVNAAVALGLRAALPHATVRCLAVGDGGEGTAAAVAESAGMDSYPVPVTLPHGMPAKAFYYRNNDLAWLDAASAIGLASVPAAMRDPEALASAGLGQLIAGALDAGVRRFRIGLGGSATCDGGMGAMHALGFRFLDSSGRELAPCGASLGRVASVDRSSAHPLLHMAAFEIACDVRSPLCGPTGAARMFAPQKGASPLAVERLDKGLLGFGNMLDRIAGRDIASMEGSGAAGGIAAAMAALLGAGLHSGIDMVMAEIGLREALCDADMVITGEGRIDAQTAMGKTACGIANAAAAAGVRAIAVCGSMAHDVDLSTLPFAAAIAATPADCPLREAMKPAIAAGYIAKAAQTIALRQVVGAAV